MIKSNKPPLKRWLPIALWLTLIAIAAWIMLQNAHMSTDMAQFMPKAKTPVERLLLEELDQGAASRLILLAIKDPRLTQLKASDDGEDFDEQTEDRIEQLAQFSQDLSQQLNQSHLFNRVDNGTPAKKDKKHQRLLFQYRYLLSPKVNAARFDTSTLRSMLEQRLAELSSPMGMLNARTLARDPSNELSSILESLQAQQTANSQYGVWFSQDNSQALLMLQTQAAGFDLDAQQQNIDTIRQYFEALNSSNYELTLSGTAVFATESRQKIRSEITLLSTTASVVVLLILLLAYRSPTLALLSALPLGSGVLLGAAAVVLIFDEIHGITMAFGVTILGVAIDYPIHVFSHLNSQHSVAHNIRRIWPTLRLGVITTATGYLAMSMTSFSGLAQLAWFAIVGLLSAAAITRWVVPAFLPEQFAPKSLQQAPQFFAAALRPGKLVLLLAALTTLTAIIFLFSTKQDIWERDLSALSPLPKDKLALDRQLRRELGAPDVNHMVLITADSVEQALQKTEAVSQRLGILVQQKIVGSFDSASRFLPSIKTQQQRQQELPDTQLLKQRLDRALEGLPLNKDQFGPFLQAVQQSKILVPLTMEQLKNSPLGLRLETMLFQRQQSWISLLILYDAQHPQQLQQWFDALDITEVYYLNLKHTSNELVSGFRSETLNRIQWSIVAILLVLWLGLRSWSHLASATIPVVAAIASVLALLIALSIPLSLFNLVAILLVFGIGMDYGLFFSREEAELQEKLRTFHALLVCCISTVCVFGILSLSHIPVLKDIGQTVAIGVLFSFIYAMTISQSLRKNPDKLKKINVSINK